MHFIRDTLRYAGLSYVHRSVVHLCMCLYSYTVDLLHLPSSVAKLGDVSAAFTNLHCKSFKCPDVGLGYIGAKFITC